MESSPRTVPLFFLLFLNLFSVRDLNEWQKRCILIYYAYFGKGRTKDMDSKKLTKDFVVGNPLGIHARPASVFVQAAADFESEITVTNLESGHIADGRSVMSMLMLSAPQGTRIRLEISGRDADKAMEALSRLIEGGFDE